MKKRNFLALVLALCLALPGVASAAESEGITEAVYQMDELPTAWNPLGELTGDGALLLRLTSDRLYNMENGAVVPSMASSLPVDVTAQYAAQFGIPADARRNYAYLIDLAPAAAWEDGNPINADDWLFTLNHMADEKLLELELAGLRDYYEGTQIPSEQVVSLQEAGFASVEEAQKAGHQQFYVDTTGFWGLDAGWVNIRSGARLQDRAIPSGITERYISGGYLYERYLRTGAELSVFQSQFVGINQSPVYAQREDVGLIRKNSYQFVVILDQPTAAEALALELAKLTVLRQDLFGPDYATSMQNYSSCGPWRITAMEDGMITLEPNPHWQGKRQNADRIRLTA